MACTGGSVSCWLASEGVRIVRPFGADDFLAFPTEISSLILSDAGLVVRRELAPALDARRVPVLRCRILAGRYGCPISALDCDVC